MQPAAIEIKRQREKDILADMIDIYCTGNGHAAGCPQCAELKAYALKRVDDCPHMAEKSFCSVCPTHCYDPDHRDAVRRVMRYSGRRYFLKKPVKTLAHGFYTIQARWWQKRSGRRASAND